ncbi:hypothetical protein BHM03_00016994 [Ensete ventricosum]|nr:hypothetical protein BHM03_00016994 [Ensete ventricosum]
MDAGGPPPVAAPFQPPPRTRAIAIVCKSSEGRRKRKPFGSEGGSAAGEGEGGRKRERGVHTCERRCTGWTDRSLPLPTAARLAIAVASGETTAIKTN